MSTFAAILYFHWDSNDAPFIPARVCDFFMAFIHPVIVLLWVPVRWVIIGSFAFMSLSDITTHSGVSVTWQNSLHCTLIIVRILQVNVSQRAALCACMRLGAYQMTSPRISWEFWLCCRRRFRVVSICGSSVQSQGYRTCNNQDLQQEHETVFSAHSLWTQVSKIKVDLLLLHDAGPVQPRNDSIKTDPRYTCLHRATVFWRTNLSQYTRSCKRPAFGLAEEDVAHFIWSV